MGTWFNLWTFYIKKKIEKEEKKTKSEFQIL